jgi:hypothetical protein
VGVRLPPLLAVVVGEGGREGLGGSSG